MKKLLLVLLGTTTSLMMTAQNVETQSPIKKNNYFVGLSTNSLTGLSYTGNKDLKVGTLNVGVEGGYLLTNRLAVVGGAGYTHSYVKNTWTSNDFNYLVGGRLYFAEVIPVQVDYNGNDKGDRNIGTSIGYNWIVAKHLTLEPNVRYNIDTRYGDNTWTGGLRINYWIK